MRWSLARKEAAIAAANDFPSSLLLCHLHSPLGTCVGRSRNRVQTIIWVPVNVSTFSDQSEDGRVSKDEPGTKRSALLRNERIRMAKWSLGMKKAFSLASDTLRNV